MKSQIGWIAGLMLVGLAGCEERYNPIVAKCVEGGKSAQVCRCGDKAMRNGLSDDEYAMLEKGATEGQQAMEQAISEKGVEFMIAFGRKMAALEGQLRDCENR